MNAIQNVVQATKNTLNATINSVGLVAAGAAKGTEKLNDGIGQAWPCLVAVVSLPFSATEGYLVQEGMEPELAKAQAYRFVNQPLSVTIEQAGIGTGKLFSNLIKEDTTDDAVALIEKDTAE